MGWAEVWAGSPRCHPPGSGGDGGTSKGSSWGLTKGHGDLGPPSPPWHGSACTQQRCAARRGCPLCPWAPREVPPSSCLAESFGQPPIPKRGENSPGLCFSTNLPPEPGREDASLWALFPWSPLVLAPCVSFSFDPGTPRGAAPAHQPHVRVGARRSPHSGRISPLHRAEVTCVRPRKCAKAPRIGSGP